MPKVYISTINPPLAGGGAVMPVVNAFFNSEKAAKRAKKQNMLGSEVRAINPQDYTIAILLDMGVAAILAKGFKHRHEAEKALPPLKTVFRDIHIEVVRFCETALYQQTIGKGGEYE
ncbi:hypothetical protein X808_18000 [Mannheimia varigena USDA-ARS-USMARC-1296]|uniref:Uncharacterized protein n=1 Tax=Mannheimia varigena USDA-ARS-USMARC-1296 TaxID=1433287 RepID=W0QEK9_9PAST|nr:hypothetical protein [Mannheimia varigena]AHG76320.1 hypothetical protein X808_18000 [Mannheimia varigena USDA-ARS-USMARC-1296]